MAIKTESAMRKEKIKLIMEKVWEQISIVRVGLLIRCFITIIAISLIGYGFLFFVESIIFTTSMAETYKDEPKIWFQRSGSILVCLAIIVEFGILKIIKMEQESREKTGEQGGEGMYKIMYFFGHIFAFSFAIIGTLLWGYGDIIYSHYFVN